MPSYLLVFRAYFVTVALSGIFSVTFSIAFAYVADCTVEKERSFSYGVVGLITHTRMNAYMQLTLEHIQYVYMYVCACVCISVCMYVCG